jgi:hypothetical protein
MPSLVGGGRCPTGFCCRVPRSAALSCYFRAVAVDRACDVRSGTRCGCGGAVCRHGLDQCRRGQRGTRPARRSAGRAPARCSGSEAGCAVRGVAGAGLSGVAGRDLACPATTAVDRLHAVKAPGGAGVSALSGRDVGNRVGCLERCAASTVHADPRRWPDETVRTVHASLEGMFRPNSAIA